MTLLPVLARALAVLTVVAGLCVPPAGATALTGFVQAVAEAAADTPEIAGFYRDADYAPLWTGERGPERREALFRALAQADLHGLPSRRYDAAGLAEAFRSARGEREVGQLEVRATRVFLAYARDIQSGALDPAEIMPAEIKRSLPRRDPRATLAAFAAAEDPGAFLRDLAPRSVRYGRLMREKARLERLAQTDGWGPPVPLRPLGPGATGSAVVALRDRLIAMGYLGRTATAGYGAELAAAVRAFQVAHGLFPDGVAGEATLREINRSPADRLKSVIVALERERWMNIPGGLGDRHIWVNLPDFHARIVDHGRVTFQTRAVVGERRPDKRTYEFSDEMEYMEVNPDWTVPRSILGRDYLPRFQRNPNAASYLQIIDSRGRVVPRSAINFSAYTARNFPFTVRQAPGGDNALGKVKFMFPNPHAIYLHDTPAKELFSREERDYSSGCIRLNDPFEFAYRLLAPQVEDPRSYFDGIVASGRQTRVGIERHVPVHLVYFTAFPEADGRMHYRRDIYERDARLFDALLAAGVAFPGAGG
ncbi:MAG: L,D-transpeptidase family protein [Rhodobacteraceae bacterium]|nr:L,D-transpeptidase family protein [Paracoccaceae bacterium]